MSVAAAAVHARRTRRKIMLTLVHPVAYDNYRMAKQAISVTLSPDNLVWLKGRARAEAVGSLSEYLDRLLTRARFGGATPRPARSMKGALAGAGAEPVDLGPGISAKQWDAWESNWGHLLAGVDLTTLRGRRA
jgi:hypothetical protein